MLLDPTLNQRRDFASFLKLLARENPERQFTYFGELRAEGITSEIARLLAEANFTEVEIGLQSIDPLAMDLMDRHNNLRAFERGARAMLDHGIKVKVDLIIGLPGDTIDSVRRGIDYVHASGLYSEVQVFNLAVLPGTAFRQEAEQLGLVYQDRPPYYVLETPTLRLEQMYDLMAEAQEVFETEFDPLPPSLFDVCEGVARAGDAADAPASQPTGTSLRSGPGHPVRRPSPSSAVLDLDSTPPDLTALLPPALARSQAFTLRLRSADFDSRRYRAAELVSRMLDDNPFTTLQIIVEPLGDPKRLTIRTLETIREACYRQPTYLDKFYSVLPGRPKGAKRLVVLLTADWRDQFDVGWIERTDQYATIVDRENTGIHGDGLAGLAEPSPAGAESGRLVES